MARHRTDTALITHDRFLSHSIEPVHGVGVVTSLGALEHGEEMAQTIQLLIEYDSQPPFNADSRTKASPAMIEKARNILRELYAPGK